MLKVNDIVTYRAQAYGNSETVGSVEGYTLFVPQMAVGEEALVRVDHVKGAVAYAHAVRILQASPCRVEPLCPHFGKCGGCTLAHLDYAEQLRFKQNKVAANLRKLGGLDVPVLPCVPSPENLGYRNKLSLPVRGRAGNVCVGMFQRNSHNVVRTEHCALAGDWADTLVALFVEYCNAHGIVPYDERTFTGCVRHLVGRFVDGQLLVTVVSNGAFSGDLRPFQEALAAHFDSFGLFVNVNTARNNVILGEQMQHVCGLEYIEGQHLGLRFRLRPGSFFQVNDGVKNILYSKVRQLLDLSGTEVLLDCFSGIGILTNVLASDRFDTFAIEIDPSAVRDAEDMAALNGSPRITNVCGDVTVELPKIASACSGKRMTVVLDPPRKGLNEAICATLLQAAPESIVYISCDSATLARDLARLSEGYSVTHVEPLDMFPQTDQVETVCLLSKLN